MSGRPNKGMKLTKLRAAPVRRAEVPPCARSVQSGAGTASQLIPGVRPTQVRPWVDSDSVPRYYRECLLHIHVLPPKGRSPFQPKLGVG